MQESAFLAALRSDPADRLARLAYADWLEERDDLRAELIRVEEEMRLLPVFADRFWELKPRRNELRAASSPEWLAELGYGTVVEPVFRHGVPDGWRERWRLIREFTERWHRIPMPDVGGRQDEIREAEARLGQTLPPSVREYVAFTFDVAFPNGVRDSTEDFAVFRDGYQMRDLEGFTALSLLLQAEGDYHWAVWHWDLGEDDPPVCAFVLDYESDEEGTFVPDDCNLIAPTVTAFVLSYAMEYVHAEGGGLGTTIPDEAFIRLLEAAYPLQTQFDETRLFEADDILIRISPPYGGGQGQRINLEVARKAARGAVPQFLWDLTKGGGGFHGMFTPPAPDTR